MEINLVVRNGAKIFEATKSFHYKDELKSLGWRYNPANKSWWIAATASHVVQPFAHALSEEARTHLKNLKRKHKRQIAHSSAISADITVPAPEGLKYYPFQLAGIRYLLKHPDAFLADEMGLGKTIQVAGLINADSSIRKTLIVCPATLRSNWRLELERWSIKQRTIQVVTKGSETIEPGTDTLIISYELLDALQTQLSGIRWDLLVADEAHYIKRKTTKRAKALFGVSKATAMARLMAKYRDTIFTNDSYHTYATWSEKVAVFERALQRLPDLKTEFDFTIKDGIYGRRNVFVTGTPIPNRTVDLWPILQRVDPEGLGRSFDAFTERYCDRRYIFGHLDASGASNLDELQERLRSTCMLRRLKSQVLPELPQKTYQLIELPTQGKIRKLIQREKQEWEALASEAGKEFRERNALFSQFAHIRAEIGRAKLPYIIDHISNLLVSCNKLVVMAHHKDVIAGIIQEYPDAAVITGDTPMPDRTKAVDRFQSDPQCKLFVGSIFAAGTGITLTAASTVLFAEQEWAPSAMSQAEDRLHRIGTESSVLVQYLVANDSVDAGILQTHLSKSQIAAEALDVAKLAS